MDKGGLKPINKNITKISVPTKTTRNPLSYKLQCPMETKTQAIITLTPKAVEKAKKLSEQKGGYVRFGVRKGGCSGYMYDIGVAKEVSEGDTIVGQGGAEVIVAGNAKDFLKGSTIDYHDSLMGAGFRIHNPNVTKSCKCGHSIR